MEVGVKTAKIESPNEGFSYNVRCLQLVVFVTKLVHFDSSLPCGNLITYFHTLYGPKLGMCPHVKFSSI